MLCSSACKERMENAYREHYVEQDAYRRNYALLARAHQIFGLTNVALGAVIIWLGAHVYDSRDHVAGQIQGMLFHRPTIMIA